jgi:hypothetical protein
MMGGNTRCAMTTGKPINRQWIYILKDGTSVVEWEEDLVQDLLSGDFLHPSRSEFSHPIRDDELNILLRAGRIDRYDAREVYLNSLPEQMRRMLD